VARAFAKSFTSSVFLQLLLRLRPWRWRRPETELGFIRDAGRFFDEDFVCLVLLNPINGVEGELDRAVRDPIISSITFCLDDFIRFTVVGVKEAEVFNHDASANFSLLIKMERLQPRLEIADCCIDGFTA
jgi:hypothetical protein